MVMGPKIEMTFQQAHLVSDGMGGWTIDGWQPKRKIKGVLIPLTGDERLITGKVEVFADYMFAIDYPKGLTITEKDRFILKARKFGILLITDPMEQHRHLEIKLEEIT